MLQNREKIVPDFLGAIPRKYYIMAGVALVALAASQKLGSHAFFTVNPGERGLIVTLGKLEESVRDEGTHMILPYVSAGKIINIRTIKTEVESTARTRDLQRISTKLSINWRIDPTKVREMYQQIGSEQEIMDKLVVPVFDETIKAAIPAKTLEKVLTEREELRETIKQKTQARLLPYGILVADVSFLNLAASEEFTKATEERQIAEQKAISAKIVAEQKIKEAELNALQAKKEAEALVNKARGQAEAQKLLQQTLTPELLQKQAIEKWNGQYPTVMGGNNAVPLITITPPPQPTPP